MLAPSEEEWLLRKEGLRRSDREMRVRESLLCQGNGYLNIRGSLEELPPAHSGGMYLGGIYDKSEADVEELVKCPMWTDLSVWSEGRKFCVSCCKVLHHEQLLDMKKGSLRRITVFRDSEGHVLSIETVRIVSMHDPHLGYMLVRIFPRNFSGPLRILSGLNGDVFNRGFFPNEQLKHLHLERIERSRSFMYLEVKSREQGTHIAEAASWKLVSPEEHDLHWEPRIYGEKFTSEITLQAEKGEEYLFEKLAVVQTSRECRCERMFRDTICRLRGYVRQGAESVVRKHLEEWEAKWEQADVQIEGDEAARQAIRFNIYQLLINGPPRPAGVGAKFLSSEGYMGHVFWDTEIFILPFFIYNFPEVARNMLLYRYQTLEGALRNAEKMGYQGAKYAWESATTGEDVTPRFASKLERTIRLIYTGTEEDHIVSDVIYGLERYFRVTGDEAFLLDYGLEMIFLTARFWASRVVEHEGHFEIRTVIGPDEFHEHVDNNAYTNFLVSWHLKLAAMLHKHVAAHRPEVLGTLQGKLSLHPAEAARWLDISRRMLFLHDPESGLIEQFEGYFDLKDHVVSSLDRQGHPVLPKGVTFRNIQSTRLIKQADVLMLLLLFPHAFSQKEVEANYEFYEKRTMHKSSLSHCIHAMTGLRAGKRSHAYHYFMKTALFDLENLHKNTDLGIHAAAVGGTWQTVIYGFGGFSLKSDRLVLRPWLPKKWKSLSFRVRWRKRLVEVAVFHDRVHLLIRDPEEAVVPVSLYRKNYKVKTNVGRELPYCPS